MNTMDDLKASAEALAMDVDYIETGMDSELGSAYEIGKETHVTPDGGILKTISRLGTGFDNPETGDSVTVHYVGTLEDGTKFDSSRDRHEPFTFTLGKGQVIKGWDQGVATMRRGEVSSLKIRSDYGYGEAGSPPKIPSNATLIFEIELISWKSVKDIAGDGGVIKTIVNEGSGWAKPQDMDEVLVKFSARVQGSETPFYASSENGEEFSLEQDYFCKALSIAAKTMLKEETAKLVVAPEYGFGSEGRAPDVPSNAVLEIDLSLLSWKKVEKITEDGGVTKKILVESSEWKTPNADAKVRVTYEARLEDGTIFDSRTAENPLEFTTEEGEVIDGLDQAVMKMKQGEKALVTIAPQYAFGDQECTQYQATIPGNSTVMYELTLEEFQKMKDSWEMTSEEKVAAASELKEKGNRHFKAGILLRALKKWERAHDMLRTDTDLDAEHRTAARDVKKSCNLNLSAAHLKLGDCKKAIESATKVLESDCGNLKALYRRAQAYMTNGDFVEAEMDIRQGLMLDEASADFKVLLKKFKVAQAKAGRKEAALYSSMFKGLAREAKKAGKQPQTEVDGKENADVHEGNTSSSNAAASQEGIVSNV